MDIDEEIAFSSLDEKEEEEDKEGKDEEEKK